MFKYTSEIGSVTNESSAHYGQKKERVGGEVGRLIGIVLALFVFVVLRANVGYAYEREIILSDEYQTEKEKERFKGTTEPQEKKLGFKERFKLDISGGYGFSYATVVRRCQ